MGDQGSDNFEYYPECVRVVDEEVEQPDKRRKVGLVPGKHCSFVWEHYDVVSDKGKLHAQCKYCKDTNYRAEGNFDTGNCIRHLKTCKAYQDASNKKSVAKKVDRVNDFDVDVYCGLFADAIVTHNLPLSIVEDVGFRKLQVYLNPKVGEFSTSFIKKKVEALIAARKEVSGCEEANGDGVIDIEDGDGDAESLECCSVLN